ncbi:hypothetical protein [Roseibacillus persicicus]|uniref:EF-hand domain-containing protein n=1 Tax=Roseibacillus persicicus TaxID=454148 RepID=A0A918TCT8_9BACT|nr:hypothetical protein [Roseibacillus persicicus]MDQ8190651.1 hypothetical protein [Roseibacillus persicicus]GHC41257.1 hypothetical protein GCM10007100_02430 [Roseibacillus persicicus]
MKKLLLIVPIAALASCSSVQNASVADLNGDGVISDAEFKQSGKQNYVQRDNVRTESMKRQNAVDTVTDASRAVWGVRSLKGAFQSF